jgi:methionine salvage enolase-phosphatase E1
LGAALVARDMFQGTEIIFVSASSQLLEAAKAEGFHALDPAKEAVAPAKETEVPMEEVEQAGPREG